MQNDKINQLLKEPYVILLVYAIIIIIIALSLKFIISRDTTIQQPETDLQSYTQLRPEYNPYKID